MYPELEKYFADCIEKNITDNEKEEILSFVEKLHEINLLTEQEYDEINEKIDGFLCRKIKYMPLNQRALNALSRNCIYSYRQLRAILMNTDGTEKLFRIINLGTKNIANVVVVSCELGLVTTDEVLNAGWKGSNKTTIDEILL